MCYFFSDCKMVFVVRVGVAFCIVLSPIKDVWFLFSLYPKPPGVAMDVPVLYSVSLPTKHQMPGTFRPKSMAPLCGVT